MNKSARLSLRMCRGTNKNFYGKESIVFLILESFYVCQTDRNIFYPAHNQNAVPFDVPILIQNTARFKSVNRYGVPHIPFDVQYLYLFNQSHRILLPSL